MSKKLVNAAVAFLAIVCVPLLARAYDLDRRPQARAARSPSAAQGQSVAPPALAARSALPACGFAAIESWGANGFQYCDGGNIRDEGGWRRN